MNAIKYQRDNAKTKELRAHLSIELGRRAHVYGLSLPAGSSCPFAVDCLTHTNRYTGQITDGKQQQFRCFAATGESWQKSTRALVWHNFDILRKAKTRGQLLEILEANFPTDADAIRPGLDGDFYNQNYFDAWMDLASLHPTVRFYAYTKSASYWIHHMDTEGIPANFELNYSKGGRLDVLAALRGLKTAEVVNHPEDAAALGLEIDHDESHAINPGGNFALLLHGTQPKDTKAAQAIKRMNAEKIEYAYSK